MTLDPALVEKARAAGARLAEAERQALLVRADFHAAVRRVHLGGGSLREIAQALSLSHQRVQQIVRAAGGSWWMALRNRHVPHDPICTWCDRPPAEVAKLIAGPRVFICDACVEAGERALAGAATAADVMSLAGARSRRRCDFCGRRADRQRRIATGAASACSDCLAVCREILDESAR